MRTIFVGDIHGCAKEFEAILDRTGFRKGVDRLLLTGDAFSKGPDPVGVWSSIDSSGAEMVLGNQDVPLLDALEQRARDEAPVFAKPHRQALFELMLPHADRLLPWMLALPMYIEEEAFLLVHAGINPERGLASTTRDEFLTIRTWPPRKGIEGPRWHDHVVPQENLIVFGHDAPPGLVVKNRAGSDSPYLIGLDSGCVYGGCLSAYVLEENEIVQVDSKQGSAGGN